jgi:hypothetical protein
MPAMTTLEEVKKELDDDDDGSDCDSDRQLRPPLQRTRDKGKKPGHSTRVVRRRSRQPRKIKKWEAK